MFSSLPDDSDTPVPDSMDTCDSLDELTHGLPMLFPTETVPADEKTVKESLKVNSAMGSSLVDDGGSWMTHVDLGGMGCNPAQVNDVFDKLGLKFAFEVRNSVEMLWVPDCVMNALFPPSLGAGSNHEVSSEHGGASSSWGIEPPSDLIKPEKTNRKPATPISFATHIHGKTQIQVLSDGSESALCRWEAQDTPAYVRQEPLPRPEIANVLAEWAADDAKVCAPLSPDQDSILAEWAAEDAKGVAAGPTKASPPIRSPPVKKVRANDPTAGYPEVPRFPTGGIRAFGKSGVLPHGGRLNDLKICENGIIHGWPEWMKQYKAAEIARLCATIANKLNQYGGIGNKVYDDVAVQWGVPKIFVEDCVRIIMEEKIRLGHANTPPYGNPIWVSQLLPGAGEETLTQDMVTDSLTAEPEAAPGLATAMATIDAAAKQLVAGRPTTHPKPTTIKGCTSPAHPPY